MKLFSKTVLLIFIFLLVSQICKSQNKNTSPLKLEIIDSLINSNNLEAARLELKQQIDYCKKTNAHDRLPNYIKLIGSYKLNNNNWNTAIKKAETFAKELIDYGDNVISKKACFELAEIYDNLGDPEKAYNTLLTALKFAKKIPEPEKAKLEEIYYNLGVKAFDMGNISLSKKHQLKSLEFRKKSNDQDHEMYYLTFNTMGRMMWYSGQPDSSLYYFKESIKSIKSLDSSALNQYFRPAFVYGNMAVVLQAKGEVEQAIHITQNAIDMFDEFDKKSIDEAYKLDALKQKLSSIDNLGAYYNSLGKFSRAEKLLEYSYLKKKKYLDNDDINISISLLILGQVKMSLRKFDEAKSYLKNALKRFEKTPSSNLFYKAYTYTSLGSVYESLEEIEKASDYYTNGEEIFRSTMAGDYTKDFLDELATMAIFYSKNGYRSKAVKLSEEALAFVENSSFVNTLQNYLYVINNAEVSYNLKNYQKATALSESGLVFLKNRPSSVSKNDSIRIQYLKPKNLLLLAKSKYALAEKKDELFYLELIAPIKEILSVLSQRKTILNSYEDISVLMKENDEVFQFYMKLYKELYFLTGKSDYLNRLISLNESSIYSRIRSRFDFKNMSFSNIPENILEKEKRLKKTLQSSLESMDDKEPNSFFKANNNWKAFLESLKMKYPKYYKMRYASIEEPFRDIEKKVPKNTTIVRYLFIEDSLYVYVLNETYQELISLDYGSIKNQINVFKNFQNNIDVIGNASVNLYKKLWQPFQNKVNTQKVIIFPDKDLFNLSFELLSPHIMTSFKDFSTKSLFSKHIISYNYSLLLLDKNTNKVDYRGKFIAFAPEFSEAMKNKYQFSIIDSMALDKSYLTLLHQPFNVNLAKHYSQRFDGKSFLNENASKQLFVNSAKEHKIIHIGTHAENNNISPELSRLVFAKDCSDNTNMEDNCLYAYEIYNYDLSSELSVLTGCETGKPTYQAGEGMISLAHAFNYAGSKSILTSLWEIDEQSSTNITASFYQYLSKGQPKDEALRNAKLDYLNKAYGRTLHPQYWSGLILMGDTSSIYLSQTKDYIFWPIIILLSITLIIGLIVKKYY